MKRAGWALLVFAVLSAVLWVVLDEETPRSDSPPVSREDATRRAQAAREMSVQPEAGAGLRPLPVEADEVSDPLPLNTSSVPVLQVEVFVESFEGEAGHIPAVGLPVALGVSTSRTDLSEPLHQLVTDDQGVARVDLPWRARYESRSPRWFVWARVKSEGWLERVRFGQVPLLPAEGVSIQVSAIRGVEVWGRVIGPDGEPTHARVDWWSLEEGSRVTGFLGNADENGLFSGELSVQGRLRLYAMGRSTFLGRNRDLKAGAADVGTGASEEFRVRFDEQPPFIEFAVSGPGVLRGRLLDGAGRAVPQHLLIAVLAEKDAELSGRVGRDPVVHASDLGLQGGGHVFADAETGPDGRFLIQGLRGGSYHLRVKPPAEGAATSWQRLTEQAIPANGAPFQLTYVRSHLAIHVRRSDGELPGPLHRGQELGLAIPVGERAEGDSPMLSVMHAPGSFSWSAGGEKRRLVADRVGEGEFLVDVEPGSVVDVGLIGEGIPWRSRRVALPQGGGRVDVELVLPEPTSTGVLVLHVLDRRGEAPQGPVRVRVEEPGTGAVLFESTASARQGSLEKRAVLPTGRYLLRVDGLASRSFWHGTVTGSRSHGSAERVVDVEPGREQQVTLQLNAGSRLAVTVVGNPGGPSNSASASVSWMGPGARALRQVYFGEPTLSVALRLEHEARWPEEVFFLREAKQGTSAAGLHLLSTLALGEEATSELLAPGDYTLVAVGPDGRERRQAVSLVDGETLAVRVLLD